MARLPIAIMHPHTALVHALLQAPSHAAGDQKLSAAEVLTLQGAASVLMISTAEMELLLTSRAIVGKQVGNSGWRVSRAHVLAYLNS